MYKAWLDLQAWFAGSDVSLMYVYAIGSISIVMLTRLWWGIRFHRQWPAQRQTYSDEKYSCSAIITICEEPKEYVTLMIETLLASLRYGTKEFEVLVVIDNVGVHTEHTHALVQLVRSYKEIDHVAVGDYKSKRKNLQHLGKRARHDILLFGDSDTFYEEDTVFEACRAFSNATVGGITTAQRIANPTTKMQRLSDWTENSRYLQSMAGTSAKGQTHCLPGRAYFTRRELVVPYLDALVNETFFGTVCKSGDDRFITAVIQKAGYKTMMVPDARITTIAPERFITTAKMLLRWSRSSQRYTIQHSLWLWKYWRAFFINWTDIIISFLITFLLGHWIWMAWHGDGTETGIMFLILSLTSAMLNMGARQFLHLKDHPRDLLLLPLFVAFATFMMVQRVYGFFTMHMVGKWGTRKGVDDEHVPVGFRVIRDTQLDKA